MKIGFIDYFLDEWHANNYPKWIEEATNGEMSVTLAYALIDSPIGGRTTEQWCREMGIPKAESIEQVVEQCDAIVVLSPDHCHMHEQLSRIPLESGKPTYIDKTFAPDLETAKRIFAVGETHGTPCYSTSALRFEEAYAGIHGAQSIVSWGPNGFETYSIHQLEPIMMMIDSEPEAVMYVPQQAGYTLHIRFKGGETAMLSGFDREVPFMMNVVTEDGSKILTAESDFFGAFIRNMTAFFKDVSKAVPHEETLRIMAVRGAGLKASETPGVWVNCGL